MSSLKYSKLWCHDIENSVFFKLLEKESKKKLVKTNPEICDILFIGPYDFNTIKRRGLKKIVEKFNLDLKKMKNLDLYKFSRKFSPLRIFFSHEFYFPELISYDYSISPHLGMDTEIHLRFPSWKDHIDWSTHGIFREFGTENSKRLGKFYKLQEFNRPLGNTFLKKSREACIITSHLKEPRKSLFSLFKKNFKITGYGPYFDKTIKNHNSNPKNKNDILGNFAFNLCPHQTMYPGFYDEKVPDSFFSNCLPITWADNNIEIDFNPKSFVNLLDYAKNNYKNLFDDLNSNKFLENFTDQPLSNSEINLDEELKFIKKIISSL